MKRELVLSSVARPDKKKKLFLRVPYDANAPSLPAIKEFFLACVAKLPNGALPKT